jgi:hypothetical protein
MSGRLRQSLPLAFLWAELPLVGRVQALLPNLGRRFRCERQHYPLAPTRRLVALIFAAAADQTRRKLWVNLLLLLLYKERPLVLPFVEKDGLLASATAWGSLSQVTAALPVVVFVGPCSRSRDVMRFVLGVTSSMHHAVAVDK